MSDLVIDVRQIGSYPQRGSSTGNEVVLLQEGGLGAPYATITTADLVATSLTSGPAMGVGATPPGNADGNQLFVGDLCLPPVAQILWDAYGVIGDGEVSWTGGQAASYGWQASAGFNWATAPIAPGNLQWFNLMVLGPSGNLSLPLGTLTVARDPATALDVATAGWVQRNTVQSFNNRNGQVTLNAQDVYRALRLNDPVATEPWVTNAINNSIQHLLYTCPFVNRWNGRSGSVYLMLSDISTVFYQPGQQPISPTPIASSNDDAIATTKWVTDALAPFDAAAALSVVNVLNYGVMGDNVTDDTQALQAVLDAFAGRSAVLIPNTGRFYLTSGLTLPSGTCLILLGTLRLLPDSPAGVVTALGASRISISGSGVIDGNAAAQTTHPGGMAGLAIAQSADVYVTGITLQNAYHWNLNVTRSDKVTLDGVQFNGGGAANEFADACSDCWLTNCTIDGTGNGDYGFCFYGGVTNSGALGNVVKNTGAGLASTDHAPGIGVLSDAGQPAPCHGIIIANNICHDCAGPGFVLLGYDVNAISTGLLLADNKSYRNDRNGAGFVAGADVFIDFVQDVTISGNQISANGNPAGPYYTGIFLGPHSSQLNVTNNQIWNIGQGLGGPAAAGNHNAGIYASDPTDAYISNNHFYDNQTTPSMQRSVTGGVLQRGALIGNLFGLLPFGAGYTPDTVFANVLNGTWTVASPAVFSDGATVDNCLGVLQNSVLSGANWQHSGAWIGWNYTGNGMTNLINAHGSGPGGFLFYNVASSAAATPTLLAQLDRNGVLTLGGPGIGYTFGATTSAIVGFDVDAATNALQVYAGGTLRIPIQAANDAAAATAGVPVGGTYRNASQLMIRVA